MLIVKHKSLDLTAKEIMDSIKNHKVPSGTVVDINEDTITVSPVDGPVNLFGLITPDYEAIYYEETE